MNYLKSKLFFLPTLENIQRAGYLATLVVVLLLLVPHIDSQIDLVVYWSIVALITQIPHTVYLYILARREFAPKFNYKILFKYLVTSISVFGIMHLLMDQFLVYENNIFEFLPNLLLYVVLGGGAYLGLTYLIDSNTRKLFKAILNEIKTLH